MGAGEPSALGVKGANTEQVSAVQSRALGSAFWGLWMATGISSVGDGLVAVALPLLATRLTHSALLIAGVAAANRAASALGALPAGLLADRFDRWKAMVASDIVSGSTVALLVLTMAFGSPGIAGLYLASAVLGLCEMVYRLSMQGAFPDVVRDSSALGTANGRLIAVEGAGEQFVGPGIGGVLFGVVRSLPFGADAVSFFASAALVGASRPRPPAGAALDGARNGGPAGGVEGTGAGAGGPSAPPAPGAGASPAYRAWRADMAEGVRAFRALPGVSALTLATSSQALCNWMVLGVLVVFAERSLHLGTSGYGLFYAFSALAGVVGSFFGGWFQKRLGTRRIMVAAGLACAVSYAGLSVVAGAVAAVFVYGLGELGVAVYNVGSVTARQRLVPRAMFGRVGGIYRLSVLAVSPLGALVGGAVASAAGPRVTMVVASATVLALLAVWGPKCWRQLDGVDDRPIT